MAEKKVKQFKPFQNKPPDKTLKEEEVLRLIDAYINSPSFRLRTGSFSSEADGWALEADGTFTTSQQIISTLATGTAPLVIASTTKVNNLNVDQVDGYDLNQNVTTSGTPQFTGLTISSNAFYISSKTPSSAGDTGLTGQFAYDSTYFYICITTNTWQRVAHATW